MACETFRGAELAHDEAQGAGDYYRQCPGESYKISDAVCRQRRSAGIDNRAGVSHGLRGDFGREDLERATADHAA